jgi:hypothetical protein
VLTLKLSRWLPVGWSAMRILRAHRQNCDCKWVVDPPDPLYDLMNQHNDQRAKILDEAIAILEKYFIT